MILLACALLDSQLPAGARKKSAAILARIFPARFRAEVRVFIFLFGRVEERGTKKKEGGGKN